MKTTELPKIETLTPHADASKDIHARAKKLNARAEKNDELRDRLKRNRAEMGNMDTETLLSLQPDKTQELFRQECELLNDRRTIHAEYLEFGKDYQAEVRTLAAKAVGKIEEARELVRESLEGIGYAPYRSEAPVRSWWKPEWVESHPDVVAAVLHLQHVRNFSAPSFFNNHQQGIAAVESSLEELRTRTKQFLGVELPAAEPITVPMIKVNDPNASELADFFSGQPRKPGSVTVKRG